MIKCYIEQKRFCLKIHVFYVFSQFYFCCFTFKNAPNCSFKYFESSNVIIVKKFIKCLLAFSSLVVHVSKLMLKKDKMVSCWVPGCTNWADRNSNNNIRYNNNVITIISQHIQNSGTFNFCNIFETFSKI